MLIIIPGWRHAAKDWREVSELLTRSNIEHQILDIPGFGTVPYDPTLETLESLSHWCLKEIARLADGSSEPLVLCGHSCGGRIALKLVSEGLDADQLVLIGSPNLYRPSMSIKLKQTLVALLKPIKPLIPERLRATLRSDDYQAVQNDPLRTLYLDVVKDDQSALLPKITQSVQLLWGAHDDAAPLWIAKELEAKLAHASLDVLPNVGHNIHKEKPQLLAAKLASYAENSA